jgi:hypothetical protein
MRVQRAAQCLQFQVVASPLLHRTHTHIWGLRRKVLLEGAFSVLTDAKGKYLSKISTKHHSIINSAKF